jgi:Arf-GAP/Rho-GAP domain/ANK repeat/PH domain-containing protein 3
LKACCFEAPFSTGNFIEITREASKKQQLSEKPDRQEKPTEEDRRNDTESLSLLLPRSENPTEEDRGEDTESLSLLLPCPKQGCVKLYQSHAALEKHISFGKCKILPEKETLLDKAKSLYQVKLQEVGCSQITLEADITRHHGTILPKGWTLKTSRASKRFNETQRKYLEDKFKIGQTTGCKQDPIAVSTEMRSAMNKEGTRLFSPDEFLTPKQVQSFFSRMASKVRKGQAGEYKDEDIEAAAEQEAYEETPMVVLKEVQLQHPMVFDTFNLCDLEPSGKLCELSVSMLRNICEHYDLPVGDITKKRKAPYIALLSELIRECECFRQ